MLPGISLAELRRRRHLTQVQLARAVGVSHQEISRIESHPIGDLEIATLTKYVEGMGGKLRLVADFGGHAIRLG